MSRITISAATYAAEKMADVVFNEKIDTAEKGLNAYVDYLYVLKVPKEIRELGSMLSQYLVMVRTIEFLKMGGERITTCTTLPHVHLSAIAVTDLEFKKLRKLKDEIAELRRSQRSYKGGVMKCLVDLKTTNRVKEEFPEALEYLGEPPVVTGKGAYEELRTKIRNAKNEK